MPVKSHFIKTYYPYIFRMGLWPEIWRREFVESYNRYFNQSKLKYPGVVAAKKMKDQASNWCEQNKIAVNVALHKICSSTSLTNIQKNFPDLYELAKGNEKRSPVKMGGAGNLDLIYTLCEYLQATKVVETGVAYGWSSFSILLSLNEKQDSQLISIDLPYFEKRNDKWVGCVVPDKLKGNWELIRQADKEGLPKAIKKLGEIDFAHYDSDKSYSGRMWAYNLIWKKLRKDGILLSDDIGDNLAFRDFCAEKKITPIVIEDVSNCYQGLAIKS